MIRKTHKTEKGTIVYWCNEYKEGQQNLVFLPGLTADHRLFDKQIEFFESKANVLVWDAPGHAESYPFTLDFELKDKAIWLHEILAKENYSNPTLIGQSMGGYVSQMYLELFPEEVSGFVCIDSAPLQRSYMTAAELWMLKHTEGMYRLYPWKRLLHDGSYGCSTTPYGRNLMREMMDYYTNDKDRYCRLAGHGFCMLAKAIENDLPYHISCPTVLVCGEKDLAGSAKKYNERWTKKTGLPLRWIKDAGHNSNTDKPEEVNAIIEGMIWGRENPNERSLF